MKKFLLFILFFSCGVYAQMAPELLSPSNNSILQHAVGLQLTWQPVEGISTYEVQYALDNTFSPGSLAGSISVTGTNLIPGQLRNNTLYYWRVRASSPNSAWSEIWNFTTTPLPSVPALYWPLNNSTKVNTTERFSWSGDDANVQYMLQVSFTPDFPGTSFNYLLNDSSYIISGLAGKTEYFWRVRAYNIDNSVSGWSPAFHFKTKFNTAAALSPDDNVINIDTKVSFSWSPVEYAVIYNFQLSTDPLFQSNTLNIDTSSSQLDIDSLRNNTKYYWRVAAFDPAAHDSGNWSTVRSFVTKLQSPILISARDSIKNTDTSITLVWNKVEAADEYVVQLANETTFNSPLLDRVTSDTVLNVQSLEFGKKYFFHIMARNAKGGMSGYTLLKIGTRLSSIKQISPPDSAKNVISQPLLTWPKIPGADKYHLQLYSDSAMFIIQSDVLVSDTIFRPSVLAFDSTYYWQVLAFNSSGDSSRWSPLSRFRIRPAILFSLDSIRASINLSEKRTDSAAVFSVSNVGRNSFIIDSVRVSPDSVLYIDKKSAVIQPNSEETFKLHFLPGLIDTGFTTGTIYFFRNFGTSAVDTIQIRLNIFIRKNAPSYSDSSLAYDSTDARQASQRQIYIRNIKANLNLSIDSLHISGADSTAFKLVPGYSYEIRPGDSSRVLIQFKPKKLGAHNAVLQIISNGYPDSVFNIPLKAYGRGGELSSTTMARLEQLPDSVFEAFTSNNKQVVFTNKGNAPLNISVRFAKSFFKVENDFQKDFTVRGGDSVSIIVKYIIPDFHSSNKDTMKIIHNGFGEDTVLVFLQGSFDSSASCKAIQSDLRLNGNEFNTLDKVVTEKSSAAFTLAPDLLNNYQNLSFRINYYTGGNGERISAENDGGYNYIIPGYLLNEKGLILWGQLLARDKNNKITDSITVFNPLNVQVILNKYKSSEVNVPRSTAAEKKQDANVKWVMFGFPSGEVIADSVFKDFGGTNNMKDGEWVVYKYDLASPDSFSLFNEYSFQPQDAYFAAQSLKDTFKISYQYQENLRTKKLTDTILTTPGTNWKTISSPFLFDVEVQPPVMLRSYDMNNKTYKMTNIMRPGEGYFIEPSVSKIILKTYGEFNPQYYPQSLQDIGWHIIVSAANSHTSLDNLFSLNMALSKGNETAGVQQEYELSPRLQKGLSIFTENTSGKKSEATISNGAGGVFNITILNDLSDDNIDLRTSSLGILPKGIKFQLFNEQTKEIMGGTTKSLFIKKDVKYHFKLIAGTEEFINENVNRLISVIPEKFALKQNYPNPFNPSTIISFQIPQNSFVSLKIYDILGSEAAVLINEEMPAGYYQKTFNAERLASGVYFCRLEALSAGSKSTQTKKMLLLK